MELIVLSFTLAQAYTQLLWTGPEAKECASRVDATDLGEGHLD